MFIRVKVETSNDINVNVNSIMTFAPNLTEDGQPAKEGSIISFNNGIQMEVLDSTRSLRGYVKKALASINSGGATDPSDD